MAQLDLYNDIGRNVFTKGPTTADIFDFPTITAIGLLRVRIRFLSPTPNSPWSNPPFTMLDTGGRTVQLALGDLASGDHYTEQYSWTPSANPADPYFEADVPMSTSLFSTAFGADTEAVVDMEVNLVDGGVPRNAFNGKVTIRKPLIADSDLHVPIPLTPISAEAVRAMLNNLVCQDITLVTGGNSTRLYTGAGDDHSLHEDYLPTS